MSSQVTCICIALNHSYGLKGLYRPYDYGPCDSDTPLETTPLINKEEIWRTQSGGSLLPGTGSECNGCHTGIKRSNEASRL